jgi:cytochrome c oxidase assembly factor CtaG
MAVVSLFLMMIPETMTGFFLYSAGSPLFPTSLKRPGSPADVLADQRLGGALMWSTSMIIDVAWIAVAVHHWFGTEVVKTRRLDEEMERQGWQAGGDMSQEPAFTPEGSLAHGPGRLGHGDMPRHDVLRVLAGAGRQPA